MATANTGRLADQLAKLGDLHASGVLTDAEFSAAKRRLLETQPARPKPQQPPVPEEVLELVRQGRKIQAIKRYKQLSPRVGLRQATDIIDQI